MRSSPAVALAAAALLACGSAPGGSGSLAATRSACLTAPALQRGLLKARRPIPGRYLVILRRDAQPDRDVDVEAQELASRHGGEVVGTWRHALRGFVAQMSESQASAMAAHPGVAWIEEDGEVHADTTQAGAPWDLDRIDQPGRPLDGTYAYTADGSGVNAYIIDSGIRTTHSQFGGRASGAFTAVDDGHGTDDCSGHGTHVAGIVGGATYGVAKNVRLFAVRVLGCDGSGSVSAAISGVDWVTEHHVAPAVANVSLGGGVSAALDDAVRRSIDSGVVYAVSAGNGSADACQQSPARVGEALTVGASDPADAQAAFSNFGACVALYAPGVAITSAWTGGDDATSTQNGTSAAAPHVTGAAALFLSLYPSASPAQVAAALVSNADADVLSGLGAGSPNRLLYDAFIAPGIALVASDVGQPPRGDPCGS